MSAAIQIQGSRGAVHTLSMRDGRPVCSCPGYHHRGHCKHTVAALAVAMQAAQPELTREQAIALAVEQLRGAP